MSRKLRQHSDPPATSHPVPETPSSAPPPTPDPIPPAEPKKVCCRTCAYGQDLSLGQGHRRCRANPPQAHYLSRFFGEGPGAGVHAVAMWPVVADTDSCGHWQSYDVS